VQNSILLVLSIGIVGTLPQLVASVNKSPHGRTLFFTFGFLSEKMLLKPDCLNQQNVGTLAVRARPDQEFPKTKRRALNP
jgi:hypothetical protein